MSEAQMEPEAPETTSAEEKFFGVRTQIGKKQSDPESDIELEIVDDRNEDGPLELTHLTPVRMMMTS